MADGTESFDLAHPKGVTRLVYGRGALAEGGGRLDGELAATSLFVVSSRPVLDLHAGLLDPLTGRAGSVTWIEVPDGEAAKSVAEAEALWRKLLAGGCRRDAWIVGFGGGSVTDLAGFAAGTLSRGIRWVAAPTTLLAQVDAAVGGKTAIDLPQGKNAVGVFHHPALVLAETEVLGTLSRAQRRHGLVEAIKTAAMLDATLLDRIERSLGRLLDGDLEALAPVAAATARVKARVVERDPDEAGERQLLNFGHTLGHAIEAETGFGAFAHGDAVAWGLRFALRLSRLDSGDARLAARLEAMLDALAPPPLPALSAEALVARMAGDKKARAGGLGWVLLGAPGAGRFGVRIPADRVLGELEEFLGHGGAGSL